MTGKRSKKQWIKPKKKSVDTLWIDEDGPDPLANLEREEFTLFLAETMGRLESEERVILVLHYYEELTFEEIGEVLELPESQVSLLHGRALMVLKDNLRRRGEIEEV